MLSDPGPANRRTAALIVALGAYATLGGLLSFIGWAADIRRLTDWQNTGISIQPNATIAAVCAGIGLILLALKRKTAAMVLGAIVAFIGASTLFQILSGVELTALNTLFLFDRAWGALGVVVPGRMGPPASSCWTLAGVALMLLARATPKSRALVPLIGMLTFGVALLSITGYLYGVNRLYSLPYLTVIAFQTSTFIAAVSVGLIASVPESAPTRWLLDPGATGLVARQAVPAIILIPVVVGWIRLVGEEAGLFEARFGVAILVLMLIGLLLVLFTWSLRTISRHEHALQESERKLKASLDSITDGVVTLDRDWRYVFVNQEASRQMGYREVDLLGRVAWDIYPEAVGGPAYLAMHRAAAERVVVEYEEISPRIGKWFFSRAYPTPDGGITVYFQDVTERRRIAAELDAELAAMSRLQTLSTHLVQSGDLQSLLKEIVSASNALLGTGRGDVQFYDPATRRLSLVIHQGFGPRFLERMSVGGNLLSDLAASTRERIIVGDVTREPLLQGSRDLDDFLTEGIRAIQATPLVARDGRLLGLLSNYWDTAHRASEREVRYLDLLARMASDFVERSRAEQALIDADRRKNEFLAMLAHELRNPLAPIGNAVQVLRLSAADPVAVQSASAMLQRQVAQLVRLVDDLLDMSRVTLGKIELRTETIDLGPVLTQAVEATRPMIDLMGHELVLQVSSRPIRISADAARLSQVVGNLLTNACKFMNPGGRVTLTASQEGRLAVIRVRDEGIGIPSHQIPRIFDLFMQLDTSLERSASGLGIGLTLVKTLVELHGGTVTVTSGGTGRGSEFTVRLPALSDAADQASLQAPAARPPREARGSVLIVDDNRDGADSLAMLLEMAGHETRVAHDGERAIELAGSWRPAIILLDIGLPKVNGYDVCRRIRQEAWGDGVNIIALTGWGQQEDKRKSSEAGFDGHLVKPVDLRALMGLMRAGSGAQEGADGFEPLHVIADDLQHHHHRDREDGTGNPPEVPPEQEPDEQGHRVER